jgi:hypothetical protein
MKPENLIADYSGSVLSFLLLNLSYFTAINPYKVGLKMQIKLFEQKIFD